jgi:HD-like signal output (HDOD) protein
MSPDLPRAALPDLGVAGRAPLEAPLVERIEAEILNGRVELPVLPEIALRVRALASRDCRISEIVSVIETEPAFAAAVMRYANSVAFAGLREVDELQQAVTRLGLGAVEQTIVAISAKRAFAADRPEHQALLRRLWDHSVATALAARRISCRIATVHAETAFLAGLLHDIGKVVILRSAALVWKRERPGSAPSASELLELFDALHCRVGDSLCAVWNLPPPIREVVRRHHDRALEHPGESLVAIVAFANLMAARLGASLRPAPPGSLLESPAATALLLDEGKLESLLADVEDDLRRAREAL